MQCYADDTQVYLSFKPDSISSEDSAFSTIQSSFSVIRSWLLTNKLLINDTNSEFLIIGTRQQLSKVQTDIISVGESTISSSKKVRNLGTWLDNTLSMSTQVSKVASSCFYYIYNIRHIRKCISLGKSVKLLLILLLHLVLIIVRSSCMVAPHPS